MGASGLFNQYYPDATKWLTSRFFFTRISAAAFQLQQWTGLLQGLLDVRQVVLHLLVNQKSKHVLEREQLLLCLPGGRACGNHRRCRSQSRYYPRSSDPRNPPEIITRPPTAHFNIYIVVCKIADLQSENGSVHRVLKLQVLRVPGKSLSRLPQLALILAHSVTLL